jgi:5-methyltetrahydropteroyltriglutamate--homocysteine methyltransferase
MTSLGQPPFRADHIGSLLRPQKLRQAFRAHAAKEMTDADFRAAQDAAIRDVVQLQEEASSGASPTGRSSCA